jgi:hypothetical protein
MVEWESLIEYDGVHVFDPFADLLFQDQTSY